MDDTAVVRSDLTPTFRTKIRIAFLRQDHSYEEEKNPSMSEGKKAL